MSIAPSRLLEQAFFDEDVQNAPEAIERALETYAQHTHASARPFTGVAPSDPDDAWVRDRLAPLRVKSEGTPVLKCGGVILALFVGRHRSTSRPRSPGWPLKWWGALAAIS